MNSMREVEQVEALAMAELIPEIILVLESSAKDNTNVDQSFIELATELKVINIDCTLNNNLYFNKIIFLFFWNVCILF